MVAIAVVVITADTHATADISLIRVVNQVHLLTCL